MASHDPLAQGDNESLQPEVRRLQEVIFQKDQKLKDLRERLTDSIIANQQLARGAGNRSNAPADEPHSPDHATVADLRNRLTAKELALGKLHGEHKVQQDALALAHKDYAQLHFPFQRSAVNTIQGMVDMVHTALDKSKTDKELVVRYERFETALDEIGSAGRIFLQKVNWIFGESKGAEPKSYLQAAQPHVQSRTGIVDDPAPIPKPTTTPTTTQLQESAKPVQESNSLHQKGSRGTPTPKPATAPKVQESPKQSAGQKPRQTLNPKTSSAKPTTNLKTQPAADQRPIRPQGQQNPRSKSKPVSEPSSSAAAMALKFPPLSQSSGGKIALGHKLNAPPSGPTKLPMPNIIKVAAKPIVLSVDELRRQSREEAAAGTLGEFSEEEQREVDDLFAVVADLKGGKQPEIPVSGDGDASSTQFVTEAEQVSTSDEVPPEKEATVKDDLQEELANDEEDHLESTQDRAFTEQEPEPLSANEETEEKVRREPYMPGGYESEELTSDEEEFFETSDFAAAANDVEGEHGLNAIEEASEPSALSQKTTEKVWKDQDLFPGFESEEEFYGVSDDETRAARKARTASTTIAKDAKPTKVPDTKGDSMDDDYGDLRVISPLPATAEKLKVSQETTKTLEDTQSGGRYTKDLEESKDTLTQQTTPEKPKVTQADTGILKDTKPGQDGQGKSKDLSTRPTVPQKAWTKDFSKKKDTTFQKTTQQFQKAVGGKTDQTPASAKESNPKPPRTAISGTISSKKTSPAPSVPPVSPWKSQKSFQSGPSPLGPQISPEWFGIPTKEAEEEKKAAKQAEANKRAGVVLKAPQLPDMKETFKQVKIDAAGTRRVVGVSRGMNNMGKDQTQASESTPEQDAKVEDTTTPAIITETAGLVTEAPPPTSPENADKSTDAPVARSKSFDKPPASPADDDDSDDPDSVLFVTSATVMSHQDDFNELFGGRRYLKADKEEAQGDRKTQSVQKQPAATSSKDHSDPQVEDSRSQQGVTRSWADTSDDEVSEGKANLDVAPGLTGKMDAAAKESAVDSHVGKADLEWRRTMVPDAKLDTANVIPGRGKNATRNRKKKDFKKK